MQWEIMKHAENPTCSKMHDQGLPALKRRQDDVEHVISLLAFRRNNREPDIVCFGPGSQLARVGFPDFPSPRLNLIAVFQLGAKKCRQQVRWQVTRSHIYPRVLVHFAPEKSAAIRSLFTDDFGSFVKAGVVNQQRAAFSTGEIFRLVETKGCKLAEGA